MTRALSPVVQPLSHGHGPASSRPGISGGSGTQLARKSPEPEGVITSTTSSGALFLELQLTGTPSGPSERDTETISSFIGASAPSLPPSAKIFL